MLGADMMPQCSIQTNSKNVRMLMFSDADACCDWVNRDLTNTFKYQISFP